MRKITDFVQRSNFISTSIAHTNRNNIRFFQKHHHKSTKKIVIELEFDQQNYILPLQVGNEQLLMEYRQNIFEYISTMRSSWQILFNLFCGQIIWRELYKIVVGWSVLYFNILCQGIFWEHLNIQIIFNCACGSLT